MRFPHPERRHQTPPRRPVLRQAAACGLMVTKSRECSGAEAALKRVFWQAAACGLLVVSTKVPPAPAPGPAPGAGLR
jgi:hypothetical protein